ncbi:hypothetical protein [Methylovulum psychrotolerans]|nr:hypothetical protein [Methylovulum psychrotolerans]POZ53152.1 hypothetical protein AADEFJLK_00166 [Methylovulum psychrotolerans]
MNVKFEYLYRDAGNFKNWGEVIFSNQYNLKPDRLNLIAENLFIERRYFLANKIDIPDLHFKEYNPQLDHDWHEFHNFSLTDETPNDLKHRNIGEFIDLLKNNT